MVFYVKILYSDGYFFIIKSYVYQVISHLFSFEATGLQSFKSFVNLLLQT